MLMYLFDEQQERETYEAARDKEKIAQGRAQGIEIGKLKALIGLVKKNLISLASAASEANMTETEFANLPDMKAASN